VTDWQSYDPIANDYDRVWAPRFSAVARRIWALTSPRSDQRLLDVGTGTGVVPSLLSEFAQIPRLMVGCDKSRGMLECAKAKLPWLHVLVGEITALPFVDGAFDLVTASFVLSHVGNYHRALSEIFRVLKSSGLLAASAWAPPLDPYATAWSHYLAEAISKSEADRALADVAPAEEHFSVHGNLAAALIDAGFLEVRSDSLDLEFTLTVDEFIEDRAISSGGRLARQMLGPAGWARFRAEARKMFEIRFGPTLRCQRRAFIVIGRTIYQQPDH
jgi:ubiquinone/menaquinone biosynthesis C-methylase UbiE